VLPEMTAVPRDVASGHPRSHGGPTWFALQMKTSSPIRATHGLYDDKLEDEAVVAEPAPRRCSAARGSLTVAHEFRTPFASASSHLRALKLVQLPDRPTAMNIAKSPGG